MTNLIEVEDFTVHSEEKRTTAFQQEVHTYLERHPQTQYVDILLNDLNGVFRGKRIPIASLLKLEKGCYFPASVFAMDILGNTVEEAGLGRALGEPDNICVPVEGTLIPPQPTRSISRSSSSPCAIKMALPLTLNPEMS